MPWRRKVESKGDGVTVRELPSVRVVMLIHRGPYTAFAASALASSGLAGQVSAPLRPRIATGLQSLALPCQMAGHEPSHPP